MPSLTQCLTTCENILSSSGVKYYTSKKYVDGSYTSFFLLAKLCIYYCNHIYHWPDSDLKNCKNLVWGFHAKTIQTLMYNVIKDMP